MAEFTSRLRSDSVPAPKPVPEPAVEEAGHTASTASGEAAGEVRLLRARRWVRAGRRLRGVPAAGISSREARSNPRRRLRLLAGAESSSEEEEEEALGMTAYERERLANIRRNNEFLVNLGATRAPNPRRLAPRLSPRRCC